MKTKKAAARSKTMGDFMGKKMPKLSTAPTAVKALATKLQKRVTKAKKAT